MYAKSVMAQGSSLMAHGQEMGVGPVQVSCDRRQSSLKDIHNISSTHIIASGLRAPRVFSSPSSPSAQYLTGLNRIRFDWNFCCELTQGSQVSSELGIGGHKFNFHDVLEFVEPAKQRITQTIVADSPKGGISLNESEREVCELAF